VRAGKPRLGSKRGRCGALWRLLPHARSLESMKRQYQPAADARHENLSGRGLGALQRRAAPAGSLWITDPKRARAQPLSARPCLPNRARCASPARRIARWVTRTSGSGAVTARVDSGNAADSCRLCIALLLRRCRCELPIQNFRNCTFPQGQR